MVCSIAALAKIFARLSQQQQTIVDIKVIKQVSKLAAAEHQVVL